MYAGVDAGVLISRRVLRSIQLYRRWGRGRLAHRQDGDLNVGFDTQLLHRILIAR